MKDLGVGGVGIVLGKGKPNRAREKCMCVWLDLKVFLLAST